MVDDNIGHDLLDDEDEADGPEDIDAAEVEDELRGDEIDPVAGDDALVVDDDDALADADDDDDEEAVVPAAAEEEDEEEEDEEEDDVEASLDVILKEKLVVPDEEEDDEAPDQEDRVETGHKVLPKQPDEFVCSSCFLVKHPSQLADGRRMLCRDCE